MPIRKGIVRFFISDFSENNFNQIKSFKMEKLHVK